MRSNCHHKDQAHDSSKSENSNNNNMKEETRGWGGNQSKMKNETNKVGSSKVRQNENGSNCKDPARKEEEAEDVPDHVEPLHDEASDS